jgi:hypothetical protein
MWLVSVFIARLMAEELASCMPEDGQAIALVLDDNLLGHERGKECFERERLGIPCTLFSVAEQLVVRCKSKDGLFVAGNRGISPSL